VEPASAVSPPTCSCIEHKGTGSAFARKPQKSGGMDDEGLAQQVSTGDRLEWPICPGSNGHGRRHSAGFPSRRKRKGARVLGSQPGTLTRFRSRSFVLLLDQAPNCQQVC
jgi:hypothetical protein